jgi:hypothetical protein
MTQFNLTRYDTQTKADGFTDLATVINKNNEILRQLLNEQETRVTFIETVFPEQLQDGIEDP